MLEILDYGLVGLCTAGFICLLIISLAYHKLSKSCIPYIVGIPFLATVLDHSVFFLWRPDAVKGDVLAFIWILAYVFLCMTICRILKKRSGSSDGFSQAVHWRYSTGLIVLSWPFWLVFTIGAAVAVCLLTGSTY